MVTRVAVKGIYDLVHLINNLREGGIGGQPRDRRACRRDILSPIDIQACGSGEGPGHANRGKELGNGVSKPNVFNRVTLNGQIKVPLGIKGKPTISIYREAPGDRPKGTKTYRAVDMEVIEGLYDAINA
jgi:hypothetical protein